jgi:hypothetical protein
MNAAHKEAAALAIDHFEATYGAKYPTAVDKVLKDREVPLAHSNLENCGLAALRGHGWIPFCRIAFPCADKLITQAVKSGCCRTFKSGQWGTGKGGQLR